MSAPLTIVLLAAGLGTRFGSRKQLAVLGLAGEIVLDYTLRDAFVAGFSRAVIVVSDDIIEAMRAHQQVVVPPLPVAFVVQPSPRGTADATVLGAAGITTPCAIANADDYYGADAIAALAGFLRAPAGRAAVPRAAVVAYPVGATLSPAGGVSRAVCRTDARGRLLGIEEHTGVRRDAGAVVSDLGELEAATFVSMNLWGFDSDALAAIGPIVDAFLTDSERAGRDRRELRLPDVVDELVARAALAVDVLPATGGWLGITHPEDADAARARFAELTAVAIAGKFACTAPPVAAVNLAHGHIHETFVVRGRDAGAPRIVLQRLNGAVFRDLAGLASNWERVTARLTEAAAARGAQPRIAAPVPTRAGGLLHVDGSGGTWRATRFVEGTRVLGSDATLAELRAAAGAFAELSRDLEGVGPLVETIPRFHDLARRRADLATAAATDALGRRHAAADLLATVDRLADSVERELAAAGAGRLPGRVVHNDAKLDNVLVDEASGAVAAIVDLDTVMGGTVLNDFGELVRTAATLAREDAVDPGGAQFNGERFAALAAGYLEGAAGYLTEAEHECLALAGPLLAVENGVRFLTDHLDGDVYFRIHRPGHNEQRARVQLHLAAQMLERIDELHATIASVSAPRAPQP